MNTEQRYTLEEAQRLLAERDCQAHGHNWNIICNGTGEPVGLTCSSCGESRRVVKYEERTQ